MRAWCPTARFLDANVVIRVGKPPGAPLMPRVADLVEAGLVRVVTTDLTKAEVAKKHAIKSKRRLRREFCCRILSGVRVTV